MKPLHPEASVIMADMVDVRLHRVNPIKLKLKAGSLEAESVSVDLSASSEHLLAAVLTALTLLAKPDAIVTNQRIFNGRVGLESLVRHQQPLDA